MTEILGKLDARLVGLIAVTLVAYTLGIAGCQPATQDASVGSERAPPTSAGTAAPTATLSQGTGQPGFGSPARPTTTPDTPGFGPRFADADRVVFGQSAALSGPASRLGLGMKLGIEAAFAEANRNGGVHGRRLELKSLDDTYEPELAIANTSALIDEGVFALIGAVGTPTSRSAAPIARIAKIPYIAPFTGAAFLRDANNLPNVVNLRSSYDQETEEMVARLTQDLGITRIAVMYQDDSFGRAGLSGTLAALSKRGMQPAAVGLYPRNTTAVKTGLLDLQKGDPEAVILVGAYRPLAELIAWARRMGEDWEFINISFVGSNALAEELGKIDPAKGAGVFVTQVSPFPYDDSEPIVAAYHKALKAHDPAAIPGFVSLEGYLAGRLAIAGLERCGPDLTRERFLAGFRSAEPFDLDGFELVYGVDDNQGSDAVFLTMIDERGDYVAIDTLDVRAKAGG